jgi:DUF1680 family protein
MKLIKSLAMNKYFSFIFCFLLCACTEVQESQQTKLSDQAHYLQNRAPLKARPYLELPLGAIKPTSWLLDQLLRMRSGMTGNLDEIYPDVVGARNGWLGGDGDGWERGPYWIDGLLPLAYILDDQDMKDKVQPWIEWTINNQMEDGYLGPIPFEVEPEPEPGLQKTRRMDWWPKMVMLKILQQYYNATGDERVIKTLDNYFRYQLKELPERPVDYLSLWANRRAGDNLQVVYWLYNITGEAYLLELGNLIAEQTFPYTQIFLNEENYNQIDGPWIYSRLKRYPFDEEEIKALTISQMGSFHCVNFAQGLKQPLVYSQQDHDPKYMKATKKALKDIKKYHGQPQGMYGGDEPLHGKDPVRGVEFCSVTEEMFSLECMLQISGDMEFANLLEKIAYNALPTQANDDFTARQYMQAANQVVATDEMRSVYQTVIHKGTDFVYGTLTGYPCCTCNMHQSWPKFVQNLWYATADGGVAALLYGPSEVILTVGDGINASITETTGFPFRDEINFAVNLDNSGAFPFHLRIPAWTKDAVITINGTKWEGQVEAEVAKINRTWQDGDQVKLHLPMSLKVSQWYDFARTIERGPLVYALRIGEEISKKDRGDRFGEFDEVRPKDKWNYALFHKDLDELSSNFMVEELDWDGRYPWNLENAPISIKARGVRYPDWKLVNGLPLFPAWWGGGGWYSSEEDIPFADITLVPYGCTTLRITEFPVYDLQ